MNSQQAILWLTGGVNISVDESADAYVAYSPFRLIVLVVHVGICGRSSDATITSMTVVSTAVHIAVPDTGANGMPSGKAYGPPVKLSSILSAST